jgi:hypothetical protein
MKYEYISVKLTIEPQQLQAMSMGVLPQDAIDAIMEMVAGTMNEYGRDGWRVMQPLVLPVLWLERSKNSGPRRKKVAKKKVTKRSKVK